MSSRTQPPQIGRLRFGDLSDGTPDELSPRAQLRARRFSDVSVQHLDLAGAELDAIHVERLTAQRGTFTGAAFNEVAMERVDIPVLEAARTRWTDVAITGRLGAFTAYESTLRSVHFTGCKLSFVNLRAAELLDVAFTDCTIDELDLGGAKCWRVQFRETRIGTLEVPDSTLHHVDLRGADLSTIIGLEQLRGATVTPEQVLLLAPLFADRLGLITEPHARR